MSDDRIAMIPVNVKTFEKLNILKNDNFKSLSDDDFMIFLINKFSGKSDDGGFQSQGNCNLSVDIHKKNYGKDVRNVSNMEKNELCKLQQKVELVIFRI